MSYQTLSPTIETLVYAQGVATDISARGVNPNYGISSESATAFKAPSFMSRLILDGDRTSTQFSEAWSELQQSVDELLLKTGEPVDYLGRIPSMSAYERLIRAINLKHIGLQFKPTEVVELMYDTTDAYIKTLDSKEGIEIASKHGRTLLALSSFVLYDGEHPRDEA